MTEAADHAAHRLHSIQDAMESLADFPRRGILRPELLPAIRSLTKDGTILYFEIREDENLVRVLAVFLAGQDHHRNMLLRLARPRG